MILLVDGVAFCLLDWFSITSLDEKLNLFIFDKKKKMKNRGGDGSALLGSNFLFLVKLWDPLTRKDKNKSRQEIKGLDSVG